MTYSALGWSDRGPDPKLAIHSRSCAWSNLLGKTSANSVELTSSILSNRTSVIAYIVGLKQYPHIDCEMNRRILRLISSEVALEHVNGPSDSFCSSTRKKVSWPFRHIFYGTWLSFGKDESCYRRSIDALGNSNKITRAMTATHLKFPHYATKRSNLSFQLPRDVFVWFLIFQLERNWSEGTFPFISLSQLILGEIDIVIMEQRSRYGRWHYFNRPSMIPFSHTINTCINS